MITSGSYLRSYYNLSGPGGKQSFPEILNLIFNPVTINILRFTFSRVHMWDHIILSLGFCFRATLKWRFIWIINDSVQFSGLIPVSLGVGSCTYLL